MTAPIPHGVHVNDCTSAKGGNLCKAFALHSKEGPHVHDWHVGACA